MDPLSVTASIVSFIDVAKRIKESVDKIGQNRQTLKELTSDVINELAELKKICEHREGVQDRLKLDYESTCSLESLQSELNNVLARCLKTLEHRNHSRFSSLKGYVAAWMKNAKIEGDILRLKDRVSSVHRRFTYISSLRMEHGLLVVTAENRVRMNRMEGLVSQLLIESHISDTNPATLIDHAAADGVEFQFLRLQVQKVVDRLSHISATQVFIEEEPQDAQHFTYSLHVDSPQPRSSLMRSVMIIILQILQLLEQPSCDSLLEGVDQAMRVYVLLMDLGLIEHAAIITSWVVTIYRAVLNTDATYMNHVVGGLLNLAGIRAGTLEGMDAAKSALSVCRSMVSKSRNDDSLSSLALCLRTYASHLAHHGDYEAGADHSKEALALQREASDPADSNTWIVWESSGEERVTLSSARSITRSWNMALEEGFSLYTWAHCLAYVGRYSEAAIVGVEVINCLAALADLGCSPVQKYILDIQEHHPGWVSITPPPTQPQAFASISDAEHSEPVGGTAIEGVDPNLDEISTCRPSERKSVARSTESPSTTDSFVHPTSPS
ncbi:hypothetical protein EYR38_002242 [Pleurotus pulmonarius]|nr:hypothetical protein EYR38_002242 [Pleurotus pulmonarius]